MPKEKRKYEYYVKEKESGVYIVSKFESMLGGEQPLSAYTVKYDPPRIRGKCDCWPGRRGAGESDKHVGIVKEWLEKGKLAQAILR